MSNKFKEIGMKNRKYQFFDDMIHTKNFDPNKRSKLLQKYSYLLHWIRDNQRP